LVVGWFSFTCCEDSTILLTEMLNDHLVEWKKVVDFKYLKALKAKNSMDGGFDVAFIEGAVSSPKQEAEVKKIRESSKYVVAIGACANTGMPSSSRNEFIDEELNDKIRWYLSNFDYSAKVRKLEDVIKIDDRVPGCPMNPKLFLEVLNKYLVIFNIINKTNDQ